QIPGSSFTPVALTLTWAASTDNLDSPPNLAYQVVRSATDNIGTLADAETNGEVVMDWSASTTSADISDLTPGTQYYFNVLVRDQAHNTSIYVSEVTATPDVIYMFSTDELAANWTGGSRSNGNSMCETRRADAYSFLPDANVLIFISYSNTDSILNMPGNYSVPTGRWFVGPNHELISTNWNDLFAFDHMNTLGDAGACTGSHWWAGSDSDGASIASNCTSWNSTLASEYGYRGSCNALGEFWIANAGLACNNDEPYLCIAWD
ncbi:MAG: hypothetical protein JRF63_15470, partial [Deltaproteobacteria bacterium]|nr:hypothetical protein [Deltaproteobacteria bacterium]